MLRSCTRTMPLCAVPMQGDIPASQMLNSLPGVDPARRDRLTSTQTGACTWCQVGAAQCCAAQRSAVRGSGASLLPIPDCSPCQGSSLPECPPCTALRCLLCLPCADGQRRRVQIAMGLLHPFKVRLLQAIAAAAAAAAAAAGRDRMRAATGVLDATALC